MTPNTLFERTRNRAAQERPLAFEKTMNIRYLSTDLQELNLRLHTAFAGATGLSDEEATQPIEPGEWPRKQIIGHLIS